MSFTWNASDKLTQSLLEMLKYKDILDSTHFDVALCDHFTIPCIDISQNLDIPLIITTALAISQGNMASKHKNT